MLWLLRGVKYIEMILCIEEEEGLMIVVSHEAN